MDAAALTKQFSTDGFAIVRGVCAEPARERLSREVGAALDEPPSEVTPADDPILVLWRHQEGGSRSVLRLVDLPSCAELVFSSELHAMLAEMTDAKHLQLFESIVFHKPAGRGQGFSWHNDCAFYPFAPPNHVSVWVALDRCTATNGAMIMAAGSHRFGDVPPVDVKTGKPLVEFAPGRNPLQDPTRHGFRPVTTELEAGDAIVFDGYTWHSSGPNADAASTRRGFCFRFLTQPTTFVPRPGVGGTFMRQIRSRPGEPLDQPSFPVVWTRR